MTHFEGPREVLDTTSDGGRAQTQHTRMLRSQVPVHRLCGGSMQKPGDQELSRAQGLQIGSRRVPKGVHFGTPFGPLSDPISDPFWRGPESCSALRCPRCDALWAKGPSRHTLGTLRARAALATEGLRVSPKGVLGRVPNGPIWRPILDPFRRGPEGCGALRGPGCDALWAKGPSRHTLGAPRACAALAAEGLPRVPNRGPREVPE